jgi:hypothetical protein
LTVFAVALMLGGVWIGYATDENPNVWVAIALSVVFTAIGIAVTPHAIEMGLRLRRDLFGAEPTEREGELGEDR